MKRSRVLQLGMVLILLLVLGGISGVALAEKVYTGNDNGKTITVSIGEQFTLYLPENPSTGYAWDLTVGSGLQILSDRYVSDPVPQRVVGSGGHHTWTILALSPGTYTISGVYKHSWEPASDSDEHFTLNVIVTLSPVSSQSDETVSPPDMSPYLNEANDIGYTPSAILSAVPGFDAYINGLFGFMYPVF